MLQHFYICYFCAFLFKPVYNKYFNNRTSHQTWILMMNLVNYLIFASKFLIFLNLSQLHTCMSQLPGVRVESVDALGNISSLFFNKRLKQFYGVESTF